MKNFAEITDKLIDIIPQGLTKGLGEPEPGQMCVEAAVNYAMGAEHSDEPDCVGEAVRAFKIALNDMPWPTKEARASGMIEIAVAQLGSNKLDQAEFIRKLYHKIVTEIANPLELELKEASPDEAQKVLYKHATAVVALNGMRINLIKQKSPLNKGLDYFDQKILAHSDYMHIYDRTGLNHEDVDMLSVLRQVSKACLSVLQEMGCEGCQYVSKIPKEKSAYDASQRLGSSKLYLHGASGR